jgi:TIR domain
MSPGGCRVAGRVFISYRRADTANQAGWLADRLAGHFGRQQVVRDVEEIQLGNDFADVIAAAVTPVTCFSR